MATLTATPITRAGIDIAGVQPGAGGDEFVNTGKELVLINNASGGSIDVTLDIKSTVDGAAVTDPVVAVADGVTKAFGPFQKSYYNDTTNDRAKVTCSAQTGVTIKVLSLTPATT